MNFSLSKKVKKRRITSDSIIPNCKYTFSYCKTCTKFKECKLRTTLSKDELGVCSDYSRMFCKHTTKFPYVCNGCRKRGMREYPKFYYKPLDAHAEYKYTLARFFFNLLRI